MEKVIGSDRDRVWDYLDKKAALSRQGDTFLCHRCNNSDRRMFADINQGRKSEISRFYCIKCLNMGRVMEGTYLYYLAQPEGVNRPAENYLTWTGQLSKEQARASRQLIESLETSKLPHLVHAVTGAGKTEMIFPVINEVLKRGGRVCIASPRIDVCLELYPRLKSAFNPVDISLLYGGSQEDYRFTSLVIATSHQLLRFKEAFNLLIMDEVDAFPYVDDPSLHFAAKRSIKKKGKLIYLTATPDDKLLKQIEKGKIQVTRLPARYHGYPLTIPEFLWIGDWRQQIQKRKLSGRLWKHLTKFLQVEGVKLIFMPDIFYAEALMEWLNQNLSQYKIACVHSKDPQRKEKVDQLRQGHLQGLISTTILERGVTFTNCQVTIIGAEDSIYTRASLVQMSGRVGRKPDYPSGHLYFAHFGKTQIMKEARKEIIAMNQLAKERGLLKE